MSDVLIGRTQELEQSLRRLRDGRGLRLTGDAGSGKTRLLRALGERLTRRGDRVIEAVASPATKAVPLGPLLSLLPTEPSEDLGGLIRSICAELAADANGARLVVSIDDVHHLDEPSVALLSHLLTASDCHLVCTVRSGERLPGGLAELWSTFDIDEVTLEPLAVDDVAALAEHVLGGPAASSLSEVLAERSAGNPLLVRELLLDAREADQLREDVADGWVALVPLDPGRRTVDVVRRRVSRLPDEVVDTLELIALADEIRLRLLPDDRAAAIDELEDQALVRVERPATGAAWHVRVDHPLVGEALVAALPVRRRLLHLRRLVELVTDAGCPEPGDASKVVDWLEAAGDPVGARECLRAAREALAAFDLDRAERWALRAGDGEATAHDVQRALGEILRLRGDLEGAAAALALAEERAQNDVDVASVAVDRSALLAFQLGRAEDAISVLEDAAERIQDPMRAIALRSEAALIGTLLGRFDDVLT
ncbi:MAG: AAA family ATPase, partial [Acidimicrobiales bacterium]|nr:AAA family ATPase [Acidimicrobiales bacterium]